MSQPSRSNVHIASDINGDKMNELVTAKRVVDWRRPKALVLDSVSSPITRRVYNLGLDEFFEWFGREPRSARGQLEALVLLGIVAKIRALRRCASRVYL